MSARPGRPIRWLLAVAGLGGGIALTARLRRRRKPRGPVSTTGRAERNAQLVGLGGRVGREVALHRARTVFASAPRRAELTAELQLRTADEVARTLGQMKGAMMKIGQMASYLDDGLPAPVRDALATLQADAPAMAPELAAAEIERELGAHPDELFDRWDPEPIAAASIGQVHRAVTRDGRAVAVKVQYPGVADAIAADLGNADLLFGALRLVFPGLDPGPVTAELRTRIAEELDYRNEAANQMRFARFFDGHPFLHVPAVHEDLSTSRILTTDLATGSTFTEMLTWPEEERNRTGEALFRFVFRSLYRLGAFNADPHPGNYLFRPGGGITLLDFGLVRNFADDELARFRAMISTMVIDHDPAAFRRAVEDAGLLARSAPVDDDEVTEFYGHFYRFVRDAAPFTITPEYASATVRQTFNAQSPVTRHTTLPASFVLVQRINLGLYALLGRIGATANWRRIAEELWPWVDAGPSTPLGEAEAAWLADRGDAQAGRRATK